MSDRLGRYTLVRPLGHGAMGEVWEAWLEGPQGFRKPVALKRLRSGPSDAEDREALLQEARLGALLHHPNVVGVYALEQLPEGWTIVMELVRGASVSALLSHGPLPARAVVDVGMQVARGLVHIHALRVDGRASGLVHRDIKPSNLLVDRTGLVKVADLGVSSLAGDDAVVGTPGYMAPEQWLGLGDARVDVFALGVTLFHCATGTLPFGRDLHQLREPGWVARLLDDPDTLAAADRAVPGLAAVLARLLAPDPDRRCRTALAALEALVELSAAQQLAGPSLPTVLLAHRPDLDVDPSSRTDATLETVVRNRGNLPPEPNAFIGRQVELNALVERVQTVSLLTLLGPGGMGKTRLARRAAASLQSRLAGGAWFIDLSEARSAHGICSAAGRDLGLQLDQTDPVAQLGWALEARGAALFVLDNLEQCVEPARTLVQSWRKAAPRARFLCTSRIALGLTAEHVLKLGPLAPDEGVALFLDRSPVMIPAADHDELRALVEELDGLPLAIELVAARTRLVPVPVLHSRLGLRLLAGGTSERPERHRSLEACLQWSWELLSEPRREALAQLSVFDGSFDLPAAEAVLDLPAAAGWALDALGELADASLVRVDPDPGRFGLLNVVRSFAEARLETRAGPEARHGRWYAQLRRDARPDDLDNLIVGCQRAVERADADTARGCALGAWFLLELRGPVAAALPLLHAAHATAERPMLALQTARMGALGAVGRSAEGIALGEAALADAADASPLERSQLLHVLGMARFGLGQLAEATELLLSALPLCRAANDRGAEGNVRTSLGALYIETGRTAEAQQSLDLALVALREAGDRRTEGRALGYLGTLNQRLGHYSEAAESFARALALLRETGDHRHEAVVLGNVGVLDRARGDFEHARAHQEEALAVHRRAGNRAMQALAHTNLGNLNVQLGDLDRARARYEAAIAVTREVGDRRTEAVATGNLGHVQAMQGDPEAETNLRASVALLAETGDRRVQGHMMSHLARVCAPHDPDQALALLEEAEAMLERIADPVMLASMLLIRAEVLHGTGDASGAEAAVRRAEQVTPADHVEVQAQLASTRALLDGSD